jgi:S-formylglutathione hydrolase
MTESRLERFQIDDPLHGRVPCVSIRPDVDGPLPLCLFLYGGGGSSETLTGMKGVLDRWWSEGALAPLLIATPDVGPWSFYLDDAARGMGWESFIAQRFLPQVCARHHVSLRPGLVGVSMGGYGALKLALGEPARFRSVAVVSPMLEPAFEAAQCPLRNRFHYPPEVPQALLGPERDPQLYRRDHPACRARRQASALRASDLALSIDASGDDAFHAQDGAELLHRVLWELDVPHEYVLRRDADHVGPDLLERLLAAFRWNARHLGALELPPLDALETSWQHWLGHPDLPPPAAALPPTSRLAPALLRWHLRAASAEAARLDPTFLRSYGQLPDTPQT